MTADAPDPDRSLAAGQDSTPRPPQDAGPAYPMVAWTMPPAAVEPPQRSRRGMLTTLRAGAAVVALTLLGAPLGLLWLVVAPDVPVVKVPDGVPDWPGWRSGSIPAQPQPEQFIAADGWFSLLGLGFGVLAAVAVWLILRRHRGAVGLVAVVLGSLGAAWLAWWIGAELGLAEYHRLRDAVAAGDVFDMPPQLRAGDVKWIGILPTLRGVLLVPAFGAAVAYTLLAGWSRYPGLRPEPEPTLVTWGPAAPDVAGPPRG